MIHRTPWFDRKFPALNDPGVLPAIVERLDGTYARLQFKLINTEQDLSKTNGGLWSTKKEVGHMIDLEPLWKKRALQILLDEDTLLAADLSNRKTHETDHDARTIDELLHDFKANRDELIKILRDSNEEDLHKTALHPRLKTPMTLVDLAYFVAEHDDHHLARISEILQ